MTTVVGIEDEDDEDDEEESGTDCSGQKKKGAREQRAPTEHSVAGAVAHLGSSFAGRPVLSKVERANRLSGIDFSFWRIGMVWGKHPTKGKTGKMVRVAGVEPTTCGSGGRHSIQLSYTRSRVRLNLQSK